MNLSKIKLIGEDEHSWTAHDGAAEFKIGKHGLSQATHDRIKQHFDEGGDVETGPVQTEPMPDEPVRSGSDFGSAMSDLGTAVAGPLKTAKDFWGNAAKDAISDISGPVGSAALGLAPDTQKASPPVVDVTTPLPRAAPAPQAAGTGGSGPPPRTVARAAAPMMSSEDRQINKATEDEAKAIVEAQRLVAVHQEALAGIRDTSNASMKSIWDKGQADMKANYDAQQKVRDDIANNPMDFNRFWGDSSVPSKISASIGMILGGIGSGITGGPNQAVNIIQDAIHRDVEQQKENLGRKKTLLDSYVQQGHSLQDSMKLAEAHEGAMAEGYMAAQTSRYAGLATAPEAQKALAQLQFGRMQKIREAHQSSVDLALKNEQRKHAQYENAMAGRGEAALPMIQAIRMKQAAGQGLDERDYLMGSALGAIDPKDDIKLDDDGLHYSSGDPKQMEQLKDVQAAVLKLKSAADAALEFRKEHTGASWTPEGNKQGKIIQNELEADRLAVAERLKGSPAAMADMKDYILNPADVHLHGGFESSMKALKDMADRAFAAETRTRLRNGGGQKKSGLTIKRANSG